MTITDVDQAITIRIADTQTSIGEEAGGTDTFTITLSEAIAAGNTVTVDVTFGGDAEDADFVTAPRAALQAVADATAGVSFDGTTLTFDDTFDGTTLSFSVTAADDDFVEVPETVLVNLASASIAAGPPPTIAAATASATITDDDLAVRFAVAVSEEGLPNGVPDFLPDNLDTTNSPTASGTIIVSDAEGDPLTITLGIPSGPPLTSGGVEINWTLGNVDHTLIGKAGATTIVTATITDAGAYTVTLSGPVDHPNVNYEDDTTFDVPVALSDGQSSAATTLSVTVEDDSPNAEPVDVSLASTDSKTNVMLILDLSGIWLAVVLKRRRRRSTSFWINTTPAATWWCGSSRSQATPPRIGALMAASG